MKWTVGRRVAAGYAMVLLLLLAVAGLGVFSLSRTAAVFKKTIETQDRLLTEAQRAESSSYAAQTAYLRYMLLGRRDFLNDWRSGLAQARKALTTLETASATADLKAGWKEALGIHDAWQQKVQSMVVARQAGRQNDGVQVLDTEIVPLRNRLAALIQRLGESQRARTAVETRQAAAAASRAVWTMLMLSVITLATGTGMAVGLTRSVTGTLTDAINRLTSASTQIVAATTQQASGVAEEATAVQETTTTVDEVKQTAQVSAERAQAVVDTAARNSQISQEGCRAVEQTAQGMQEAKARMETIAERILVLSEQGQAIGEIITTVNELAEQSNILAVNAAIEAAKAGEAGRGFGVVAAEVKALAEQSKQATGQVRGILHEIQRATQAAVMATEQGVKAAETGENIAAQAGEAIRTLTQGQNDAAQAARQILITTQQQVVGVDQIATAMQHIQQSSAENMAATQQVNGAAHDLSDVARTLKVMVSG